MARTITSKSKREVPTMKRYGMVPTASKKKARTQPPTIRTTTDNINALKRLRDCLVIRYENDLRAMEINELTIDDALTYVLNRFSWDHQEIAELLSIDSKMTKVIQYSRSG